MPKYKVFAVMELGSTAIRLKVAQFSQRSGIDVIEDIKYHIDAGSEVYSTGQLSYPLIDKICRAVSDCMRVVNTYETEYFKCYASTAFREAENVDFFLDQAWIRCGVHVEIISNEEEMFLHHKALALNSAELFDRVIEEGAVFVDVNSGNTQVSYYTSSRLQFSHSIPIGSLRVLELLSSQKNPSLGFSELLEEYIKAGINNYRKNIVAEKGCPNIVLIGANSELLCSMSGAKRGQITPVDVERAHKMLRDLSPQDICDEYRISYEEAQLLLPTVLIHKKFAQSFTGINVIPAEVTIAEGMCVEYIEKNGYAHTNHRFTDDILSSARLSAAKYAIDNEHCKRMLEFAECIYMSLSKKFGLSKKDLLLLRLAVIFADTGRYINVNDHARLSYHITVASPLIGLPTRSHEIIALTTLFQNGICESEEFKYMSKGRKVLTAKLAAILSVCKALDYKYDGNIKKIRAAVKNDKLIITAAASNDITVERTELKNRGKFFEEVFGLKPEITKGVVK